MCMDPQNLMGATNTAQQDPARASLARAAQAAGSAHPLSRVGAAMQQAQGQVQQQMQPPGMPR